MLRYYLLIISIFVLHSYAISYHKMEEGLKTMNPTNESTQESSKKHCPDGWYKDECFCYFIGKENVTWQTAVERCIQQDSQLVSIHSGRENKFVGSLASYHSGERGGLWIGLHDQHQEDKFQWIDESNVTYTKYSYIQQVIDAQNCSIISKSSGQWRQSLCIYKNFPFVCKKTAKFGECGNGWKSYNNSTCFAAMNGRRNFHDSMTACHKVDGHLATIDSEQENQFVSSLLTTEEAWIGLNYINDEWVWQNGSIKPTYTNWAPGEPTGDCMVMHKRSYFWRESHCSVLNNYACKKSIGQDPSFQELAISVGIQKAQVDIKWEPEIGFGCHIVKVKTERVPRGKGRDFKFSVHELSNPNRNLPTYNNSITAPQRLNISKLYTSNFNLDELEPDTAYNVSLIWSNRYDKTPVAKDHVFYSAVIVTSSRTDDNYIEDKNVDVPTDEVPVEKEVPADKESRISLQGIRSSQGGSSMVWWAVLLLCVCVFLLGLGIGYMYVGVKPRLQNYKNVYSLEEIKASNVNLSED